jgi:hypothetical protein
MTCTNITAATITALLIDPLRAEARRIPLAVSEDALDLKQLYTLLACDLVERAPFDERHVIWADENGWDQATGFTTIDGGRNAIAGRFLIAIETDDGEPQGIAADVPPLLVRLVCHRCLFDPEFVTRTGGEGGAFIVETRLAGVTPRITKTPPRLMES